MIFALFGKKLYLLPILDMYNSKIISYNISDRQNLNQGRYKLNKVFEKSPYDTHLIFHFDQGRQY